MSFGDRFKKARLEHGFSQQELAEILCVTDGTISNYESGKAFPRWDAVKKICDILHVDPNYMFWDDLSDNIKAKIIEEKTFIERDEGILMYNQLDTEDKAEIRGEMRQMLKSSKYGTNSGIKPDIAEDMVGKVKNIVNAVSITHE